MEDFKKWFKSLNGYLQMYRYILTFIALGISSLFSIIVLFISLGIFGLVIGVIVIIPLLTIAMEWVVNEL